MLLQDGTEPQNYVAPSFQRYSLAIYLLWRHLLFLVTSYIVDITIEMCVQINTNFLDIIVAYHNLSLIGLDSRVIPL